MHIILFYNIKYVHTYICFVYILIYVLNLIKNKDTKKIRIGIRKSIFNAK
jgi:hypothetical protein